MRIAGINVVAIGLSMAFFMTCPTVDGHVKTSPSKKKRDLQGQDAYFSDPLLKWSTTLEGTGPSTGSTIESGNAVSVSPENNLVYVTLSDGRLEVLAASDGAPRWGYTPTPIGAGWSIKCNSGVYFGSNQEVGKFVTYAIIDVPPSGIGEDFQSRVIAVSHPSNELLWISDPVSGEIQGTPVISQSFSTEGQYVFFTHNINTDPFGGGEIVGVFSIVRADDEGSLLWSEIAGEADLDPDPTTTRLGTLRVPYGPVGVAHFPLGGRYTGGENNLNDLIVWSVSIEGGRGPNGYTRAFQIPPLFQADFVDNTNFFGQPTVNLRTTFLREVRWNAAAPPEFSSNGLNLIFGVRPNALRGWTGLRNFDENANMVVTLEQDLVDMRAPIPKKPVLSQDNSNLFVFASVPFLYGLDASTGAVDWEVESDSLFTGTINVSPDGVLLYTTQANGNIAARRQNNGDIFWEINCDSILAIDENTTCVDNLQGDFSLSPNGLVLYYGDQSGNIVALQVAESRFETNAPTEFPTVSPTFSPTEYGSGVPSDLPSLAPSNGPTFEGQTPAPAPTDDSSPDIGPSDDVDDETSMDSEDGSVPRFELVLSAVIGIVVSFFLLV